MSFSKSDPVPRCAVKTVPGYAEKNQEAAIDFKEEKLFLLTAVLLAWIFQACCGPNACPQAKSGASVLNKAVAAVESYKERNGRYPVRLDDVEPGFQTRMELELHKACPDCSGFAYKTDSFGYEIVYLYPHMGRNRCVHNNELESWSCKGIY